jgi:hypothetical protein
MFAGPILDSYASMYQRDNGIEVRKYSLLTHFPSHFILSEIAPSCQCTNGVSQQRNQREGGTIESNSVLMASSVFDC